MSLRSTSRRDVIRTVLFDTQPLWRSTLASLLGRAGLGPVMVCKSLDELSYVLDGDLRPQLLVADPDGAAGFAQLLSDVHESLPRLTTIVVSARGDEVWRAELEDAGVADFITKQCELVEIEALLQAAVEARLQCSRLTLRELEILQLVAEGCSNRQVAAALWLSDQTVKFHLANVYRKLGVASRADAVAHARREGILPTARVTVGAVSANGGDAVLAPAVTL
jgi:DNA-binding NarL/FixJ family response regulator